MPFVGLLRGRVQCRGDTSRAASVKRDVFLQTFHIFAQVAAFVLDEACARETYKNLTI